MSRRRYRRTSRAKPPLLLDLSLKSISELELAKKAIEGELVELKKSVSIFRYQLERRININREIRSAYESIQKIRNKRGVFSQLVGYLSPEDKASIEKHAHTIEKNKFERDRIASIKIRSDSKDFDSIDSAVSYLDLTIGKKTKNLIEIDKVLHRKYRYEKKLQQQIERDKRMILEEKMKEERYKLTMQTKLLLINRDNHPRIV